MVLIGRSSRCRVQLPGPEVASTHAALIRTAQGAWLIDLLGPGGIEVAGRPERFARLEDGQVRVGPHFIGVRLGLISTSQHGAGLPAIPTGASSSEVAALTGSDLLPMFEEFGRIQDRMGDQFQQALMTMFQLFSGMHQEQMTLIRQELSRVHLLDEQRKGLESRLAQLPPESSGNQRPAPPRARSASTFPGPKGPIPPQATAERPGPPDLHFLLTERMAALGEERQNLWQKLVGTLLRT